jgi:hypothetical protein
MDIRWKPEKNISCFAETFIISLLFWGSNIAVTTTLHANSSTNYSKDEKNLKNTFACRWSASSELK